MGGMSKISLKLRNFSKIKRIGNLGAQLAAWKKKAFFFLFQLLEHCSLDSENLSATCQGGWNQLTVNYFR